MNEVSANPKLDELAKGVLPQFVVSHRSSQARTKSKSGRSHGDIGRATANGLDEGLLVGE